MEVEVSPPLVAHTPESLRQRQRDRLSPRRGFAKKGRISTTVREVEGAPRSRMAVNRSPDAIRKRQLQDGLRKENSVSRRMKRGAEDGKDEVAPDGGSAGREGRQFTVANVGNNGRIYLR
jgi:hypothetical protein